jgi:hypothetical protein
MAAIVREEPPPMDEKLPAPLNWIIDRCLQKEPEQRYVDAQIDLRNLWFGCGIDSVVPR